VISLSRRSTNYTRLQEVDGVDTNRPSECEDKTNVMLFCIMSSERMRTCLEQPGNEFLVEPTLLVAIGLLFGFVGQESLLFAVDLVLSSVEIGFMRFDHLGLHVVFVAKDANQVDGNTLANLLVLTTLRESKANLQGNL
jgi:hypothetical protein